MFSSDAGNPHYSYLKAIYACTVEPGIKFLKIHAPHATQLPFNSPSITLAEVPEPIINGEILSRDRNRHSMMFERECRLREWVKVERREAVKSLGRGWWEGGRPHAWMYRVGDGEPKTIRFVGDWIFLCSSDRSLVRVERGLGRLSASRSWVRSDTRVMMVMHRSMGCDCHRLTGEGFKELDRIERDAVADQARRPPLRERERAILRELLSVEAFDGDHLVPTEVLAARIGADANSLKHPIAEMKRNDLVHTQRGPNGGVWLAIRGRKLAVEQFAGIGAHQ